MYKLPRLSPFASDEARLECLFILYEKMTSAKKRQKNLEVTDKVRIFAV